jgi:hypothetical protein
VRTQHTAVDAVPETASGPVYEHRQRVQIAEGTATVRRGLRPHLDAALVLGVREVHTTIRFVDPSGAPFVPRYGALHHRDETPVRATDPWLLLHGGGTRGPWSAGVRAGVTIPLGRTEPDPFALGDAGLAHEHLQFGTGTFDPLLGASVSRRAGRLVLSASTLARWTVATNTHGYRAGDRWSASVAASRPLRGPWRAAAGLDLSHEAAERWQGVVRTDEGNLGRSDLLASLSLVRARAHGTVGVHVHVPLRVRATGSQLHYPVIVALGWSR